MSIEPTTGGLPAVETVGRTGMAFAAADAGAGARAFPDSAELWRLYAQRAGSLAENNLVEFYLPLVRAILSRLAGSLPENVDRDDLQSAGVLGLLEALRKFDPAAGVPFEGYARLRIRGAMLDELRRMDWVPRTIHQKSKQVKKVVGQLEQRLGRAPSKVEMAEALDMTAAEYDALAEEIRPVQFVWLDSPHEAGSGDEGFLYEVLASPDQADPVEQASSLELREIIFERLQTMPKIQQTVLTLYFLEGMYLHEIAATLGLTEGRISQIQAQAIGSIRAYLQRYENGMERPPVAVGGGKRAVSLSAGAGHSVSKTGTRASRRAA